MQFADLEAPQSLIALWSFSMFHVQQTLLSIPAAIRRSGSHRDTVFRGEQVGAIILKAFERFSVKH
jgi:hypothetical protein